MKRKNYRSSLLGLVSHELNTPLTGIYNAIALLEETHPEEKSLAVLKKSADRLKYTIDNILEASKADAGLLKVRLSEISVANVVLMKLQQLSKTIKNAGFLLEKEIEEDLPTVCADSFRIAKVVELIVQNIIQFSLVHREQKVQEIPRIKVQVSLEEFAEEFKSTNKGIQVTISTNTAISKEGKEVLEHIFEPFYPWKNVLDRKQEGLGLELSLAKEIMIAHDGLIWLDDLRFCFALPLLSRADELEMVIHNRLYGGLGILEKLSLLLLKPKQDFDKESATKFAQTVSGLLFRSSDSAFMVPETGELTVIMDDCHAEAAKKVAERLLHELVEKYPETAFLWSTATGPDDGSSAEELLDRARGRWQK